MRSDFVIKDLVVSIPRATGASSVFIPADEGGELPWWLSPIAGVLVKGDIIESVSRTITEAIRKGEDLNAVAAAFTDGDPDGNPSIRNVIHEIGSAVVAGVAFTAIGGAVGMPDPGCDGTSTETIPTPLTPIIHKGIEIHRVTELPKLRKQLALALETMDRLAEGLRPQGDEIGSVAKELESALGELRAGS